MNRICFFMLVCFFFSFPLHAQTSPDLKDQLNKLYSCSEKLYFVGVTGDKFGMTILEDDLFMILDNNEIYLFTPYFAGKSNIKSGKIRIPYLPKDLARPSSGYYYMSINKDRIGEGPQFLPGLPQRTPDFRKRIVTKSKIEEAGLDWKSVSQVLVSHGWAMSINDSEVQLFPEWVSSKNMMPNLWGKDSSKILSILMQSSGFVSESNRRFYVMGQINSTEEFHPLDIEQRIWNQAPNNFTIEARDMLVLKIVALFGKINQSMENDLVIFPGEWRAPGSRPQIIEQRVAKTNKAYQEALNACKAVSDEFHIGSIQKAIELHKNDKAVYNQ